MVTPALAVLRVASSVVLVVGMKVTGVRTWRMHAAFSPLAKAVVCALRLLWLLLMMSSFGAIHASRAARIFFAAMVAAQFWSSVLTSVLEASFSRIAPTDWLLGGRVRADTLFGWWYDWWELGHSAWKPRERRPLFRLVNGSLFWVLTFTLKISVEYIATSSMVPSATTFITVTERMLEQGNYGFAFAAGEPHCVGQSCQSCHTPVASRAPNRTASPATRPRRTERIPPSLQADGLPHCMLTTSLIAC